MPRLWTPARKQCFIKVRLLKADILRTEDEDKREGGRECTLTSCTPGFVMFHHLSQKKKEEMGSSGNPTDCGTFFQKRPEASLLPSTHQHVSSQTLAVSAKHTAQVLHVLQLWEEREPLRHYFIHVLVTVVRCFSAVLRTFTLLTHCFLKTLHMVRYHSYLTHSVVRFVGELGILISNILPHIAPSVKKYVFQNLPGLFFFFDVFVSAMFPTSTSSFGVIAL